MRSTRKKELEHKKKELKEDVFVESMTKAWAKTTSIRTYIIVAVVTVALGAVVWGIRSHIRSSGDRAAWTAYARLEMSIAEKRKDDDSKAVREKYDQEEIDGLAGLIGETDGTSAQAFIMYKYAHAVFSKGGDDNVKKAQEACATFAQRFPKHEYVLAMKLLQGKALFQQKSWQEALGVFQEVYDAYQQGKDVRMGSLQYEASYYIGRSHELLGNLDKAQAAYELLATHENESPLWADMARFRLAQMKS